MSTVEIPKLEYAFSVRIEFKERLRFEPTTPMGGRVYVPVTGGTVSGPRLQGRVMPYSGADWARGRSDSVAELNAHYMLEASDGAPIYLYNRGYLYGRDDQGRPLARPPEGAAAAPGGAAAKDGFAIKPNTYFFITPVFDTPVGPHDWLTRTVFLGRGTRKPDPDHTVFDYFAVTG